MVMIFYEILSIPLKISFDLEISPEWDRVVDSVFYADILISFNTAYYNNGILVALLFISNLSYFRFITENGLQ
jgi:hyperpolarization activated cyclic nucleotide-gated potassium channel 2